MFKVQFDSLFKTKEILFHMSGLGGAGKTTTIHTLNLSEVVNHVSPIGTGYEEIKYKNISFKIFDAGAEIREGWIKYHRVKPVHGLVFMVDAADHDNLTDECGENNANYHLHSLLKLEDYKDTPLLVLNNKLDLPNARSQIEVTGLLNLNSITDRQWYIQDCVAIAGDGLYEGFSWLIDAVLKRD